MPESLNPFWLRYFPIGLIIAAGLWAILVVFFWPDSEQPRQRPHDPGGDL